MGEVECEVNEGRMRYLSVCSGIEAATVAWHPLGWMPVAFSEIEEFPRSVLAHHYPQVPCHGDFTTIGASEYGAIDLLVGGTPCQSFSVAGLRGGIHDSRGNLALEFLRLLDRTRPRWVVWENVPGVFSATSHDAPDFSPPQIDLDSDDAPQDGEEVVVEDRYDADESHALACFLAGLSELGYGFAYRVLDAQYAGVPQRRRRVFVVGHLGDWRRAAAVLFERHSLSGHPAPRREARASVAALTANGVGTCGADDNQGQAGHLIPYGQVAPTLDAHMARKWGSNQWVDQGHAVVMESGQAGASICTDGSAPTLTCLHEAPVIAHSLRAEGFDASEDGTGRGTPLVPVCFTAQDHGADASGISPTLRSGSHSGSHANGGVMPAVAFTGGASECLSEVECGHPVTGRNDDPGMVMRGPAVRRLTPVECERLQGFPGDYTLVPYRGKPAADGPRYKALGNSMAVPVMRWIGQRVAMVEALQVESLAA